ncbi:inactive serine protease PAMR1 isoform X2 [Melanotaenia boesemani]|uniref:inactive serine protease PAMR1 isoform X2 n=1 Tax=Melanotaenia boesemani TaxID=1250792 RepID=UPI001C0499B5|nr:inactive serine protease PAMR1 isoform X2 [Melanotaenia boesemani]
MLTYPTRTMPLFSFADSKFFYFLLNLCFCLTGWIHALTAGNCPSSKWNAMCRPCCEYHLIQCWCPSNGLRVGYTVPCCRGALDQCDPCIIHPGCSLFENCKSCLNGTWRANDDFFVNGKYCTECRQGWSGGDCKTCGGIIQRAQGHVVLESYPTNARCEWIVQVKEDSIIELRFSALSLESDFNCRYDYVEVRDGDDLRAPVIGRFCGDQLPLPIKSSRNVLHILFTSDGYNSFDGFVFIFQESSGHTSPVQCSPPPKLLHGHYRPAAVTFEGAETVEFFCKKPYLLIGNHQSTCLSDGSWSGRPPKCVRVCQEPKVFGLVRQSVVKPHLLTRYNMRDLLSAGFIPLTFSRQSKEGRDDSALEKMPQGFHQLYTSIEYTCASPLYRHMGSSRRTCLKTGRWSESHVSCSPVCGKLNTFSRHNLSDTQWPWHAAIYIRLPPEHTTISQAGGTVLDQQGASEESTFWSLACSGALVAQRRVLVAAQCVLDKDKQQALHPAHVKVVIGMKSFRDRPKNLHHLRVADILFHPDFYSAPDVDVAMLKLQDKAKISEHVLPVCLPKIQGGEVTVQEAYTVKWIPPNNSRHLSRHETLSQTKAVELSDVSHCEREFAQGGAHATLIGDNSLCVISKPSSPPSLCPSLIPGITIVPPVFSFTDQGVLTDHEKSHRVSTTGWQLLGLESFIYEKNCHQQSYTVQTKIANFRDWIEKNIE